MHRLLRQILAPHATYATPPLIFFAVAALAILQLPVHLLLRADFLSLGIAINELLFVAGLPLALIALLHLDRARLLPLARPSATSMALVVIATLGAVVVLDYATYASELIFPLPEQVAESLARVMAFDSRAEFFWKLVLLCAFPAVCEELFFRGFCQTSLAARWGTLPALVVSAFLFAVLHGNPWYLHLYVLLGLLLGGVYALTGTLWAPILCHFLNNCWTFLNHARGFAVPLEQPFGVADGVVLVIATAVFLLGMLLLHSGERSPAT